MKACLPCEGQPRHPQPGTGVHRAGPVEGSLWWMEAGPFQFPRHGLMSPEVPSGETLTHTPSLRLLWGRTSRLRGVVKMPGVPTSLLLLVFLGTLPKVAAAHASKPLLGLEAEA